jgi:hypothetical protein
MSHDLSRIASVGSPIARPTQSCNGLKGQGTFRSRRRLRAVAAGKSRLLGASLLALAVVASVGGDATTAPRDGPLPAGLLDLVQDALWLTGDYSGTIEGRATAKDIHDALKAFRAREGLTANGEAGRRDIEKLQARARTARVALGLEPVIDAVHNIVLMVPRALLPQASRVEKGRRFVSADGKAMLATFARPGGRPALAKLRDELAAGQNGKTAALTADGLLLAAEEAGTTMLVRASENAGMVKGVIFSYPAEHAERYERVARYVLASFDPTPQLPRLPSSPPVAASEQPVALHGPSSTLARSGGDGASIGVESGRVAAQLSVATASNDASEESSRPTLAVTVDGQKVVSLDLKKEAVGWTSASVEIATLDTKAALPAVVTVISADPAGCCSEVRIATVAENGWRVLAAGPFRGVPHLAEDPERQGAQVLIGESAAFHDAFGAPDSATAPLTILRLDGEWLADVTRDAAFRPFHAAQLAINLASAKASAFRSNSVWPGIIASARLIGEGDEAAELMEKQHDPSTREGREICSLAVTVKDCPPEQIRIRTLAAALDEFLAQAGFGL